MDISKTVATIVILSALSGAIHVFVPDLWLPASVVAWQRGWNLRRSSLFAVCAFVSHVLLGVLIYLALNPFLGSVPTRNFLRFAGAAIVALMVFRLWRLRQVKDVLRAGPQSTWGLFAVFSLLGPSEWLVPILFKAKSLGVGYFVPSIAFLLGTLASGLAAVLVGRKLWNRPLLLSQSVGLGWQHLAVLPIFGMLALGISAILRIS